MGFALKDDNPRDIEIRWAPSPPSKSIERIDDGRDPEIEAELKALKKK